MPDRVPGQIPEQEISRDERAQFIINFLKRIKADEIFTDTEHKRNFIEGLDYQGFRSLLETMNGVLRDIPIAQREADGKDVILTGFIENDYPPLAEDKDELLEEVFRTAQGMNREDRDIHDIALLLGSSINALHLFKDANGRTSRLVYTLLTEDFSQPAAENNLVKRLSEAGRDEVDISPAILYINQIDPQIEEEIKDSIEPKPVWKRSWIHNPEMREICKEKGFSEPDAEFMIRHIDHERFGYFALLKYLNGQGRLGEYVQLYGKTGSERLDLNFDKFIRDMTQSDFEELKREYWQIRKKRVQLLIDIFANPDKHPARAQEGMTAKDFFAQKIKVNTERNSEENWLA